MSPRNPELPEGTDHIINGAMETSMTPTSGSTPSGTGFIAGEGRRNDTGGTASGTSLPVKQQLKESAQSIKEQAGGKVREFAEDGKKRAASTLDDFSKVVGDAADSIDERLGADYGVYARRAADAVSGFADTLRGKDVDELYDEARALVRKSPAVAIGVAAAVGFALVRLVKSGVERPPEDDVDATDSTNGAGI